MQNYTPIKIGNNIRLWRIIKGYKQNDFAKQLNVSKATISKIENDKQKINIQRLQQMATVLNIKIAQLLNDPSSFLPPPQ